MAGLYNSIAAVLAPLVVVLGAGCGTNQQEAETPTGEAPTENHSDHKGGGIAIESEVGALNEGQVKQAFNGSIDGMMKCFRKGIDKLPYLSGAVRISVRVPTDGKVRAFMKESTLGDRETERCMLGVIAGRSWPAPVGGKEGIAENEFTFDPAEGARQAVSWNSGDAGKNVDKAMHALGDCRRSSGGAGKLSATLYVDTDGTVKSVGVAGEDVNAEQAADCVVKAMKDVKFNSPGSFAAKLTLSQ